MIIFDWDGTLCDSTHHIVASVQTASREMGLPVPSDEAAANIIGLGLPEGMARLFPEVPEEHRKPNGTMWQHAAPIALRTDDQLRDGLPPHPWRGHECRSLDLV